MSLFESALTALFVMAVVFAVLGALWVIIRIFSFIIKIIESRTTNETSQK